MKYINSVSLILLLIAAAKSFATEGDPEANCMASGIISQSSGYGAIDFAAMTARYGADWVTQEKRARGSATCPAAYPHKYVAPDNAIQCAQRCECPPGFEEYDEVDTAPGAMAPKHKCRAIASSAPSSSGNQSSVNSVNNSASNSAANSSTAGSASNSSTPNNNNSSAATASASNTSSGGGGGDNGGNGGSGGGTGGNGDGSGAGGNASSSANNCASGMHVDANGSCTTCPAGKVLNIMSQTCDDPITTCVYPARYSVLDNTCNSNPEQCAQGAFKNVLTGTCDAYGSTSCPAGWHFRDEYHLRCDPDQNSTTSSGSNQSQSNTSAQSNTSSGNFSSHANTSYASNPVPVVGPNDNTSPTQSTSDSRSIPPTTSRSLCLLLNTTSACNAIENCKLTFGSDHCVGLSSAQTCPNMYVVNGQKICVTGSGSTFGGSGSNTSSGGGTGTGNSGTDQGAGECDPTSKSYDECMGRLNVPDSTQTQGLLDKGDQSNAKALDDYSKSRTDDITKFTQDGVNFTAAPNQLKAVLMSYVPHSSACVPPSFEFKGRTFTASCSLFDNLKLCLSYFLSVLAVIYIWSLATKPVER